MKTASIIGILLIATVASAALGGLAVQYYHGETVKLPVIGAVTLEEYFDGFLEVNGTLLDWGELEPGKSYTWDYTVKNVGTTNYTCYRICYDLPSGWTETWSHNNTVFAVGQMKTGLLTLTIPAGASGTYNWHSYLYGEEV